MKRIGPFGLLGVCALGLSLAGCSLVYYLEAAAAWAKPVATAISSAVTIVDPSNTKIGADANTVATVLGDVSTDAEADAMVGTSEPLDQKVLTDLQNAQTQIGQIETDLGGILTLSQSAKSYIGDVLSVAIIADEGYQAIIAAKDPAAAATAANAGHPVQLAALRSTDGCAEFDLNPGRGRLDNVAYTWSGSDRAVAHITIDCGDPGDAIDLTINAKGDAEPTGTSTSAKPAGKRATAAQFKRQFAAICAKYGYPAPGGELKTTWKEKLVHVVTFGRR